MDDLASLLRFMIVIFIKSDNYGAFLLSISCCFMNIVLNVIFGVESASKPIPVGKLNDVM